MAALGCGGGEVTCKTNVTAVTNSKQALKIIFATQKYFYGIKYIMQVYIYYFNHCGFGNSKFFTLKKNIKK